MSRPLFSVLAVVVCLPLLAATIYSVIRPKHMSDWQNRTFEVDLSGGSRSTPIQVFIVGLIGSYFAGSFLLEEVVFLVKYIRGLGAR